MAPRQHRLVSGLAFAAAAALVVGVRAQSSTVVAWGQWRGPARDGVVQGFSEPAPWPETLGLAWRVSIGGGYSTPVVGGSTVFLHSRGDAEEIVSALDLETGRELWSDRYPAPSVKTAEFAESEGEGPYSTPVFRDGRLYTVGVHGVVTSYDASGGAVLWRRDFSDLIVETERFCGVAPSPLLVDGRVVVQIGDDDSLEVLALSADTGRTEWSWEGPATGNASPNLVQLGGVRHVVAMTDEAVVGLAAADGTLLWQHEFSGVPGSCSTNIPTPVTHGEMLIVSGVRPGTRAITATRGDAGRWTVEQQWENSRIKPLWSNFVVGGDEVFGISQTRSGQLVSLDARTGELLWSTEGRSGENGFVVDVGRSILFLMNDGDLLVARKTHPGLEIEKRYTVADAAVWSYPLVLDGGILVRDSRSLTLWSF